MTFNPISIAISLGRRFSMPIPDLHGNCGPARKHKSVQTRKKMRNRKDRKAR